ncbi:cytochrome b [Silanimonas algicola]
MSTPRYAAPQRWIHWAVAGLVAAAYALAEFRGWFPRGTPIRSAMMPLHFWAGIIVMLLLLPRFALRARHGVPPVTPPLPRWESMLGGLTHVALYAFLLVQPILGVLILWSEGRGIPVPFTSLVLPPLFAPGAAIEDVAEDAHKLLATVFYGVIGLHVLAAVYHRWLRRDDVVQRML